jgi:hypothetical protein
MKQLIQRVLFGYRPNLKAETPRGGFKTIEGGSMKERTESLMALQKHYEAMALEGYKGK